VEKNCYKSYEKKEEKHLETKIRYNKENVPSFATLMI